MLPWPVLLFAVVLPCLVSLATIWAAGWFTGGNAQGGNANRSPERERFPIAAASALGFATAYLGCHLGLHGRPVGARLEAWEWLVVLVPVATIWGIVDALKLVPGAARVWGRVGVAAASGWFLVPSFQESPGTWRVGLAVIILLLVEVQDFAARKLTMAPVLVAWILTGASAVPVLIASANAKFGFFATSVAAAAGGAILAELPRRFRDAWPGGGATLVVSLLLTAILLSGHFNDYGDVPFAAFLALLAAPLGLVAGAVMMCASPRPVVAALASLLLVAGLCAAALYLAWPAITAEPAY